MNIKDLFSAEGVRASQYLTDLATFVLSPRRYFDTVVYEPDVETVRRLAFYGVLFAVVEGATILTVTGADNRFGFGYVVGLFFIETASALVFLPVSLGVAAHARVTRPLKTAVVHAFTARFSLLLPVVVLYAFFLSTEDYAFAFARGVAVYAFLFGTVVILPLALNRALRRRAASLLLSLVLAVGVFALMEIICNTTHVATSRTHQMSVFYDPIGAEVDELGAGSETRRSLDVLHPLVEESRALLRLEPTRNDSALAIMRAPTPELMRKWDQQRLSLGGQWTRDRARLREQRESAAFATTRQFVDGRLRFIDHAERVIHSTDRFLRQRSVDNYILLADDYIALQSTEIERVEHETQYLAIRAKLMRWGLID